MNMTMEAVSDFLAMLGSENIRKDASRGWVRCSCPLAPWRHTNGRDKNPSFGVKLEEGKAPFYHCFACGATGALPKLLHNLNWLRKDPHKDASRFLGQFALFDESSAEATKVQVGKRIKVHDRFRVERPSREILVNKPVPEEVLTQYPLLDESCDYTACDDVTTWLTTKRKISLQSIADFKLRLYHDQGNLGVVFPILEKGSETVLDLWVRVIDSTSHTGSFRLAPNITGSKVDYAAPNLWFGNHLYVSDRPLILVEGALDAMRLRTLFPNINVLASLGQPSSEQLESIYARVVMLGFDNDEGGRRFALKAKKHLHSLKVAWLNWGDVGVKDPGELESVAQFREVFDKRKVWMNIPPNPAPFANRKRIRDKKPGWL